MSRRRLQSASWLETLVLIVVTITLFMVGGMYVFSLTIGPRTQMMAQLSNFRLLHQATQQMALDGLTTHNSNLGWPGDTGDTFASWTTRLVDNDYFTSYDLCARLSAPGVHVTSIPRKNNTAVHVYAVRRDSPDAAVFLSSANFLYTPEVQGLDRKAKPFGGTGFTIMRKDGTGEILSPRSVADTNLIGVPLPLLQ